MDNYLFIDDSGSKNWDTPYSRDFIDHPPARVDQNLNFWRSNYFVLAGLHINRDTMTKLNRIINKRKTEVFGTKYVDLHSSDLRNPHRIKKMYLDKFNITREQLRDFIENFWYPLYDDDGIQLVAVIVDKRYFLKARNEGKVESHWK